MSSLPLPFVKSPCKINGKDCEERAEGCHSVCPKYLEFKAYREQVRAAQLKTYLSNPDLKTYKKKRKK